TKKSIHKSARSRELLSRTRSIFKPDISWRTSMWRLLSRIAVIALTALVLARAEAQPPAKDPQSSFEPRSGPGAGQKYLERFVGDWDVEKIFFPRSGEPARSTGECRQKMIHDGRFLQSDFTFEGVNGNTSGMGLIGFEPSTGKFTSVWTDSRQTRMSF